MKKIILIFSAGLFLLLGNTSCGDDFLSSTPTVDIPEEEFFTSEEKMLNSVMAAYQPLMWHDWAFGQYNPLMILGDLMGGDVLPGGNDAFDNENWHRMSKFTATPDFTPSSLWLIAYSGVNRSNIVINNIDNVKDVKESVKNRIYAEALTLRAYYYHILWKYWGNVPHYNVNPSTMPFLVDQISADELYKHIVADLDLALADDKLPLTVSAEEYGRLTRAVPQMLKANVVMYQNDESKYAEVLTEMREIISSKRYKLLDDFSKVWEDEGEWSTESIFEINYSDDRGGGRSWGNPLGAGGTVVPQLIGMYTLTGSSEYQGGWGFGPVSASVYALYNDKDARKDGGILSVEKHLETNPKMKYTKRYQDTGFFNKKYAPRIKGNSNATGDKELNYRNNYRVFRFSEALLIASELIVRTKGAQTEADEYLNMVRARAFNMEVDDVDFKPYKRVATLDNLLEENRLEFIGEGHRFWDLVRFGKAEQVLGTNGYTANKKYLPIPRGEIDKAQGTLTQNPY